MVLSAMPRVCVETLTGSFSTPVHPARLIAGESSWISRLPAADGRSGGTLPTMAKVSRNWQSGRTKPLISDLTLSATRIVPHSILLVEASGKRHLINLQPVSGTVSEELLHSGRRIIQGFAGERFYHPGTWDMGWGRG